MGPRNDLDLGRKRSDVSDSTTIHTDLVAQNPLANQLLGERLERAAEFLLAAFELLGELLDDSHIDCIKSGFAVLLVSDGQGLCKVIGHQCCDGVVNVGLVVKEHGELAGFLGGLRC